LINNHHFFHSVCTLFCQGTPLVAGVPFFSLKIFLNMKFPAEVLEHHANKAIPVFTTMRAVIKKGNKATTGLLFEGRNDSNNRNIIGLKLLVNDTADGKACSVEGVLLITKEWAERSFLEIKHGTNTTFEQIPLSQLIPQAGEPYVKVWIPYFQTSVSKFTFPTELIDALNDREIVLALIHSDL
jgi:hypothetical protein